MWVFELRRLGHRHRQLGFAGQLGRTRRLFHLVAATASSPARAWFIQPNDLAVGLLGEQRRRGGSAGPIANREQHQEYHGHVIREGGHERRAEARLLLLEKKRDLYRVRTLDVDRKVSSGPIGTELTRGSGLCHWERDITGGDIFAHESL